MGEPGLARSPAPARLTSRWNSQVACRGVLPWRAPSLLCSPLADGRCCPEVTLRRTNLYSQPSGQAWQLQQPLVTEASPTLANPRLGSQACQTEVGRKASSILSLEPSGVYPEELTAAQV